MVIENTAMIFVDARNIIGGRKTHEQNGKKFSYGYKELMDYFSRMYNIVRGYYYDGAPHKTQRTKDREKFYKLLRQWGYTLRLKEIDFQKQDHSQKGVDIYLTSDMISLAYENAYDTAILASGDGDYVALVELVKSKGKKVHVLSYENCLSQSLREIADKVFIIERIPALRRKQGTEKTSDQKL